MPASERQSRRGTRSVVHVSHRDKPSVQTRPANHHLELASNLPAAVFLIASGILVLAGLYAVSVPLLLLAVAWVIAVRRMVDGAESLALRAFDATDTSETEDARLHNVAEGLCLSMGIAKPRLIEVRETRPFAAVLAGRSGAGTILVSEDFVKAMDRMEYEAVLAQMLSRLRSGDARARTEWMALRPLLGRIGLSSMASRAAVGSAAAPPDHLADDAACRATRYPPALVSALEKVRAAGTPDAPVSTSPSWFAVPVQGDAGRIAEFRSLNPFYSAVGERIDNLKETYQC